MSIPFTRDEDRYLAPDGWDITLEPLEEIEKKTAEDSGIRTVTVEDMREEAALNRQMAERGGLFVNADLPASAPEAKKAEQRDGEKRSGAKPLPDPTGKELGITMDEKDRITDVTLPDGAVLYYEYDDNGDLIRYTNPEGEVRRYEYDSEHRMTAWYDEEDNRVVENVYDGEDRVISQTDALGNTATLTYGEGCTEVTDALGRVTKVFYDESYRTLRVQYPDGSETLRSYGSDGRLESETDEAGNTTRYAYDEAGNTTQITRADGSTASYTYNEDGLPLTAADYEGNTSRFTYDAIGNLLTFTDGEGNTTTYVYDELSRVSAVTDGNFYTEQEFGGIGTVPMTFIRAPYIESVEDEVEILAQENDHIVAVREKNQLALSFHPELDEDERIHRYFVEMVRQNITRRR